MIKDGRRVSSCYALDGTHVLEYVNPAADPPTAQIRLVQVPKDYKGPPIAVVEAERMGRLDLIRCFLWSDGEGCYREVEGGHDRLPEVTDPALISSFGRDFRGYEEVHKLSIEIHAAFPQGEIEPLESEVVAFLELEFRKGRTLDSSLVSELARFTKSSGLLEHHGYEQIGAAFKRAPDLHSAWFIHREKFSTHAH